MFLSIKLLPGVAALVLVLDKEIEWNRGNKINQKPAFEIVNSYFSRV